MTGEQFLNSLRHLDYMIKSLDTMQVRLSDQRQDILDRANSAALLTGVCVQAAPGSKTESLGIELAALPTPIELLGKIEQLRDRVNRKIDLLTNRKQLALNVIDQMQTAKHQTLIIERYLNNLKWPTIADLLNYNEHYVRCDLRAEAVKEFSALFESPT